MITNTSAGARELEAPANTNVRPPVYRPRDTGVFPVQSCDDKLPPSGRGQNHVTS